MKVHVILAATAALALTACDKTVSEPAAGSTEAAAKASAALAETAAPAGAAPPSGAAVAAGSAPTRAFLIGKWAEPDECALALQFKADGTMVGPFERWTLENGVLAMEGNPSNIHLKVIDRDTMESRLAGTGKPRKLIRCT